MLFLIIWWIIIWSAAVSWKIMYISYFDCYFHCNAKRIIRMVFLQSILFIFSSFWVCIPLNIWESSSFEFKTGNLRTFLLRVKYFINKKFVIFTRGINIDVSIKKDITFSMLWGKIGFLMVFIWTLNLLLYCESCKI